MSRTASFNALMKGADLFVDHPLSCFYCRVSVDALMAG